MLRWEDLGLFAILLAHSFFLVHPADVALLFLLPQSHSLCFSTGAKNPLSHPFIHFPVAASQPGRRIVILFFLLHGC
jgi:hypothetical protein